MQIPITPFISTTYPEINNAVIKKDWPLLRRLLKRVTLISGGWTLLTSLGLLVLGPWLLLFYGRDFQPAYVPMLIFLVGLGFANIFFGTDRCCSPWDCGCATRYSLYCGIAKVALAFLLVPRLGLNFEAFLLSAFFVVSVGLIIARGFREVRRYENAAKESSPA